MNGTSKKPPSRRGSLSFHDYFLTNFDSKWYLFIDYLVELKINYKMTSSSLKLFQNLRKMTNKNRNLPSPSTITFCTSFFLKQLKSMSAVCLLAEFLGTKLPACRIFSLIVGLRCNPPVGCGAVSECKLREMSL